MPSPAGSSTGSSTPARTQRSWSTPSTCPSATAGPEPVGIVHCTQFTSWVFGEKILSAGLLPSFGTVGDGRVHRDLPQQPKKTLDTGLSHPHRVRTTLREQHHPGCQLATETGAQTVGQVKVSPHRALVPPAVGQQSPIQLHLTLQPTPKWGNIRKFGIYRFQASSEGLRKSRKHCHQFAMRDPLPRRLWQPIGARLTVNHHETPAWAEGQSPLKALRINVNLDLSSIAHTCQKGRKLLHERRQIIRHIERPIVTPEATNPEFTASRIRQGATGFHDKDIVIVEHIRIDWRRDHSTGSEVARKRHRKAHVLILSVRARNWITRLIHSIFAGNNDSFPCLNDAPVRHYHLPHAPRDTHSPSLFSFGMNSRQEFCSSIIVKPLTLLFAPAPSTIRQRLRLLRSSTMNRKHMTPRFNAFRGPLGTPALPVAPSRLQVRAAFWGDSHR
jgi:hypothetical protein